MTLRTDLAIAQLPSSPPFSGLLGLNAVATDPIFGTTMMRLTDGSSGTGNFRSMQTSDSPSDYNVWNADDTLLALNSTGGNAFLFQFNPTTMQGTQLGTSFPYKLSGPTNFSKVSPGVLYNVVGTVLSSLTYQLVSGVWTYQSTAVICDFADILPVGFVVDWHSVLSVSAGDAVFGMGFSEGHQNSGFLACAFKPGSGFRMLNTQTLSVTGDWGTIGTATLLNTEFTNFFLHGVNQSPNPNYFLLSAVGSGPKNGLGSFVWPISGLAITQSGLSGHHGLGVSGYYTGGPGLGQYDEALYSTPTVHTPVIPKQAGPPGLPAYQTPSQKYFGDQHSAFSPLQATDQALLFITNGAPSVFPFTSCWMGELRALDVNGAFGPQGMVYRVCHTYNSGKSTEYITANSQIGTSQTGNFIAFNSDMGGAGTVGPLGSTSGGATGLIGENARGDVFIVAVAAHLGPPALAITTSDLAEGVIGIAFNQTLQAIGGTSPYLWSVMSGNLPAGLALNATTGVISGIPTAIGIFNFSVLVTDSTAPTPNIASVALSITVDPALSIATTSLAPGHVSIGYNQTLQPAGGISPYAWALASGTLPPGLTLNASTGVIAGTPRLIGTFTFSVSLTDSETTPVTVTSNLSITITAGPAFVPSGEMYDITDIDNPGMANHHLEVWCQVIVK